MSQFFTYRDSDGIMKEAEAFIVSDYTTSPKANAPLKTDSEGYLDPTLLSPEKSYGIVEKTEYFTLSEEDADSKKIYLSSTPVSSITLVPNGALPQRQTIDFQYNASDNSVTWAGLGLDGFLEANETIQVSYFHK